MAKPNGPRIRELRVARGYSQEQFAVRAGLTRGTIDRIESGVTWRPSLSTLGAIAGALDVAFEEVVEQPGGDPASAVSA